MPERFSLTKSVSVRKAKLSSKYFTNSSLSSLRVTITLKKTMRTTPSQRRPLRYAMTSSPSFTTGPDPSLVALPWRIGKIATRDGKRMTVYRNAAVTPIVAMFPRSLKGRTSLRFSARRPMQVVRLVRNTGLRLMRMLSVMASFLLTPLRIDWKSETSRWMLSATARVMITVGALELGGVIGMPSQPASPIAVDAESMMISSVISMPQNERRNSAAVMRRIAYMSGIRVDRS